MVSINDTVWQRKDLIDIESLSIQEIEAVFRVAKEYKDRLEDRSNSFTELEGTTVVNLFIEPSTRTRVAFEVAAKKLGASVINIASATSSLTKGESLRDTALNLKALQADIVILRDKAPGSSLQLSKWLAIPVINAGDGAHEHPTQALLDCFTLHEQFKGTIKGKKVTILGDILHSRVARSNIWALQKLGAEVTLAGPLNLVPKEFEAFGVTVCHDLKSAIQDADVVMCLRIQQERLTGSASSLKEYKRLFGLNKARMTWMKPDVIIMHPGPINRGVEMDADVADSENSVILEQVTNGVVTRMAVLAYCYNAYKNKR
ncbi:MAG: aspartate carbamoyltransferase [Verrucomicrobia bacterium CG_4_10_14_3_um_filter_43_23]|nr:MAG: aspartate carbamoyltransferase [Verrucomicrobia bacterium CG1_02_43_26]PIP59227.1 MAG: aspartate carbamoyltransferase [Verrucomicrobia bacterium CG22_combo_CG10-13_8_21_14_all_43_17]PIX58589.1 MAG: aspartate carbamoyltransferase [Verrucomicrobia bacterium CG_4_10_14_3_um_filter_43_23]PIY61041.1 MAG: aspartate carbamoyltransferase [Verrucomicrobia bacterium CG_4_10_14_0_8_um_filter_43_34]PJA43882.1 MAG: aspartate carbamoyltransferase [Verrucomicrobia bacterium CG_4_9_14_3_um_filter_43_20